MQLPKSHLTFYGGVTWFSGLRTVWLGPKSNLIWTDHAGYDKGWIREASQDDIVRVLREVFLT